MALTSRAIGPKTLVPFGSFSSFMITTAFSSKLSHVPSILPTGAHCRTITAFWIVPFFTTPRGAAVFTETTIVSPILAYLLFEPPRTFMHITVFAPVLSATRSLDCIWIIFVESLEYF